MTKPRPAHRTDRGRLLIVLALPVVVVVAVVVGGVLWSRQQPPATDAPLAVAAVPAPGAQGRYCTELASALPATLGGLPRRTLIGETSGTAAWGEPASVLRCGLPTPAELTCSSALTAVSTANGGPGVQWLQQSAGGQTTYLAADRPVRVAITVPDGAGTAVIQEISSLVAGTLPSTAQPDGTLCSGGRLPAVDDG